MFQKYVLTILCFIFLSTSNAQTKNYKAKVIETDSFLAIPFAIVQVKGTLVSSITDGQGIFNINCKQTDSLIISKIGYEKTQVSIKSLFDTSNFPKIYIPKKIYIYAQVTVTTNRLRDYKRKEYETHLNRVRPQVMDGNMISLLYDNFSRRGQEKQKLDKIYTELLILDALDRRIGNKKLKQITNDSSFTFQILIENFPISENFINNCSDYYLYNHIKLCYLNYKINKRH